MSIVLETLEYFWNTELSYKGVPVNGFGIPTFLYKKESYLRSNMYRLSKKGFLLKTGSGYKITEKGKEFISKNRIIWFDSPFTKKSKKDLLFMFDIKSEERQTRDWLRSQLKIFGYEMVQKSVWLGPSPLPKDFVKYLKSILKLEDSIKTFRVSGKK